DCGAVWGFLPQQDQTGALLYSPNQVKLAVFLLILTCACYCDALVGTLIISAFDDRLIDITDNKIADLLSMSIAWRVLLLVRKRTYLSALPKFWLDLIIML
ncbi:MAG: hypothetical protein JAZ05_00040, partial [Candidatus Thiodiazotropha taylori]|nr:hypothetical protein [Candidatus Thiodiazotropha taylori]MCW4290395.1 hypothetical protein [Candidatus Thiodiazotropha taylori]